MHRKSGSSDVIQTLHKLGYGILYAETLFIEANGQIRWNHSQQLYHQVLKKHSNYSCR